MNYWRRVRGVLLKCGDEHWADAEGTENGYIILMCEDGVELGNDTGGWLEAWEDVDKVYV